jgi:hypothetical protein
MSECKWIYLKVSALIPMNLLVLSTKFFINAGINIIKIFSSPKRPKPALGLTQPPIQSVPTILPGGKAPGK